MTMLVGELESALLREFPAYRAEEWDRTGMLVGDAAAPVSRVAVALDPTLAALDFACKQGANVLVTHHPLFLDAPASIQPNAPGAGRRVWHAVAHGIAVLSFHTALDASPRAAGVLAAPLGLKPNAGLLEPLDAEAGWGYGRLCRVGGENLGGLASRCRGAFGHEVRVWGDPARCVNLACLWTGAAGDCPAACLARGVDVLICGEVKYHAALDAAEAGLCLIELGHDVSEQPHCGILVESVVQAGVDAGDVRLMELPGNWR